MPSNSSKRTYVDGLLDPVEVNSTDSQLGRMLSIRSAISPTSSSTHEQAREPSENVDVYQKIGAGSCGAIFTGDDKSIVVKVAKHPESLVWNDYRMHTLIYNKIQDHKLDLKVPKCHFFVPKRDLVFAEKQPGLYNAAIGICRMPADMLVAERIPPLPRSTRTLLIRKYCSEKGKEKALIDRANNDCLVRVYLGSSRGKSDQKFFSLRNFKIHLNQLTDLRSDVTALASEMGKALAIMHWDAKVDARDVEFVLGGSVSAAPVLTYSHADFRWMMPRTYTGPKSRVIEDFFHRETNLWLLDFNQVRPISMNAVGVAQAIEAAQMNDPYLPKPHQDGEPAKLCWNAFTESYLQVAQDILIDEAPEVRRLPLDFLLGLMRAEGEKVKAQSDDGDA
ncbi:zinc finger protein-domain-containing protein [Xylaria intraflava]|nr:zinc finger protein-domain-containing protein [Xylaria intraflava]